MKRSLWLIAFSALTLAAAEPLPPIVPIVTPADLDAAIADVAVSRIELLVPADRDAAERVLSKRFFNRLEERRFSGLLAIDWEKKWQRFSGALVAKAKAGGLDIASLEKCLQRLNRGRTRESMLEPFRQQILVPPDASREEREALEKQNKKEKEEYEAALKDREAHPEKWYNDSLAVVPVGAFLGTHSTGECWIIVCKWELSFKNQPAGDTQLGHVMIWAMDTRSHDVVAYVTCD
ncbi:hypothetical protein [Opitutus sp. ER46]|uniref:hypothetical protein n=1 Tax=Opitutus sp. ER46 TaxID=2161864 RepID=UPI000D2F61B4|nr:hypothetical protein [Opitutus sp. ER46]PTX94605.1 hypothetical protein DB354_12810 [Opitutus sp. ER46]